MLNLNYVNDTVFYQVSYKTLSNNIVEIKGDFPIKTEGFILTRVGAPTAFRGDYSGYTTVYKEIEGGVQFSNNGSVWIPEVEFSIRGVGSLEGEEVQKVYNYEDLIVPTPVAGENYEFQCWSPEIPESGKIDRDVKFTAIFTYIPTEEELQALFEQNKQSKIAESKILLEAYLEANPIISTAHGGEAGLYSVTSEKQSLMMSQYMTYQIEKRVNPDAVLTWNETGKACEVWTEEEFLQLVLEIKSFVYPLVSYQQTLEESIAACTTQEELDIIVIDYSSVHYSEDESEEVQDESEEVEVQDEA